MVASLRSYLPRLSQILGLTPIALYERQRELIRAKLLTSEGPKRGPGAGVRLSPDSVAVMVISVLATDSLSEVAEQTRDFANATFRERRMDRRLEVTSKKQRESFREAVATVLSDATLARHVQIEVFRSERLCEITIRYYETVEDELVELEGADIYAAREVFAAQFPLSRVSVNATFDYPALIAEDLRVAAETGEAPQPFEENA